MKLQIAIDYLKISKLHINKNAAKYKLQKMINNNKRAFFENKLTEFIGNLKIYGRLWDP